MWKIREISQKNLWESFLARYSPQSFFQSWNWGEVIKKMYGQNTKKTWRWGIFKNEVLLGIAQVVKVEARRGHFFHIRHGPILKKWERECFSHFFSFLREAGKKNQADFLRISPLIENSPFYRQFFQDFHFRDAPIPALDGEICWVLNLEKKEDVLLSQMRKTTRYLINKAQKLGVEIVKTKKIEEIEDFFPLYRETAKRHHFIGHLGIKEEFEQFAKDEQVLLFKGYYQKKLLAAALIIFYNHQAIYHHSASIEQKVPVNYLLQWEAIKEAKRRGKKIYNFWGIAPSNKKSHPWQGLTLFKTGFGGEKIEYLHAQDFPLSPLYWKTYCLEVVRKFWRGY